MTEFELWFYRGLIFILFGIVLKFVYAKIKKAEENEKAFVDALDDMRLEISRLREAISNIMGSCPERHGHVDRRIAANENSIRDLYKRSNQNSEDIAALKVKVK